MKNYANENMIGKYVIIRSETAGCHFGILISAENNEVVLKDSRRIWYWDGAASISELSQNGTKKPENCKFPCSIPEHIVIGVNEIIPCSEKAVKSIQEVSIWMA